MFKINIHADVKLIVQDAQSEKVIALLEQVLEKLDQSQADQQKLQELANRLKSNTDALQAEVESPKPSGGEPNAP